MKELEKLQEYLRKINDLEYIINILNWELQTKAPKGSLDYLINVKSNVSLEKFKLCSSIEYEKLIDNLITSKDFIELSVIEQRYINNLKKEFNENKLIPEQFYKEYTILCDKVNNVWEQAKKENDYNIFKPYLKKIIKKTKELYGYTHPGQAIYDAMLDDYEIGMKTNIIDNLFNEIKTELKPLLPKIISKNNSAIQSNSKKYSDSQLMDAASYLLNYIGFDLNRGALGIYPHGYTDKMNNNDVRIAFKNTDSVTDFVSTIIHEGGHGIFEQNIDKNLYPYTNHCVDYCCALHESQSRFYENILGRNIDFWKPIYNDIKKMFDLSMDVDEFVRELNIVKPSFIRTEADEVTYCLHIIIRYEIERDLFNNLISIDDLPNVWNKKMIEYFGIEPNNANEGILQDVHWSQGSFGYFPSYLIGSIYDGMLKETIEKEIGCFNEILSSGNIKIITNWLINNIHKNGGAYTGPEIIEKICNKKITSEPLIRYFKEKYLVNSSEN
jgi:carboxypeptidase Taq